MEELSNFVFFRVIYDFIHSEIDRFAMDVLARTMTLVSAAALSVLTLWILIRGYRIVTGQSHQSMMGLVTDALRTTLILGLACGMAIGGSTFYEFLGGDLPNEISRVVTGSSEPIIEQIDRSLALMQVALTRIDSLEVEHDPFVNQAKVRALWFTGIGTAGPALMGGGVLLMNQIALALFIGLGPLFVLSLLFEQTKSLFGKWLYYGIGTMFSLALLSVMVTLALDMVLAVGAAFWLSDSLGASGEGITSLALQQGGLGLILTALIVSAPPMVAAFFNGVLGNFNPLSAFGGGMGRRDSSDSGYAGAAQEASQEFHPVPHQFQRATTGASSDQIKHAAEGGANDFLARYPNALASNEWMGVATGGLPVTLMSASGTSATSADFLGADPARLGQTLEYQAMQEFKHQHGGLSPHDYAVARQTAATAFYAHFDATTAGDYAEQVAGDGRLTMQQKYDRLHGYATQVNALAQANGVDVDWNGHSRVAQAMHPNLARLNIFDPSRPTEIVVKNPGDAGKPLRALLGVTEEADIRGMMMNPHRDQVYMHDGRFLVDSEPWRKNYELVGQVVQHNTLFNALNNVAAQHIQDSADATAYPSSTAFKDAHRDSTQHQTEWLVRNELPTVNKLNNAKSRVGNVLDAIGFAGEVREHLKRDLTTIDVFASKQDHTHRVFQVRQFRGNAGTGKFQEQEVYVEEDIIGKITGK